jgi:hypothetical protein
VYSIADPEQRHKFHDTVSGVYFPGEQPNPGHPVLQRCFPQKEARGGKVYIYYWRGDDRDDDTGWYIGDKVGGNLVWL